MRKCYEQDVPAPRVGCGCSECCRVREYSIDPRLAELVRGAQFMMKPSRSSYIIRQCIDRYIAGHVEWASLYIGIIEALAKNADESFDKALEMASLMSPKPSILKRD